MGCKAVVRALEHTSTAARRKACRGGHAQVVPHHTPHPATTQMKMYALTYTHIHIGPCTCAHTHTRTCTHVHKRTCIRIEPSPVRVCSSPSYNAQHLGQCLCRHAWQRALHCPQVGRQPSRRWLAHYSLRSPARCWRSKLRRCRQSSHTVGSE